MDTANTASIKAGANPIDQILTDLADRLYMLDEEVERLLQRITPVLIPADPPTPLPTSDCSHMSALAQRLVSRLEQVDAIAQRIAATTARVDL